MTILPLLWLFYITILILKWINGVVYIDISVNTDLA